MSFEDAPPNSKKASLDKSSRIPETDTKPQERPSERFPWRAMEKDPKFRAIVLNALELGAFPKDVAGLLSEFALARHLVPPTAAAARDYLGKFTDPVRGPLVTANFQDLGIADNVQASTHADVREYMRTHNPERLWRFAPDAKAVAAYLLGQEQMTPYMLSVELSKYLDADIKPNGIYYLLGTIEKSIQTENPQLEGKELEHQARQRLIQDLSKDVAPEIIVFGQAEGKKLLGSIDIEKFAGRHSWRGNPRSWLLAAVLFKQLKSVTMAGAAAAEAITVLHDIPITSAPIRAYFRENSARLDELISESEKSVSPAIVADARLDAAAILTMLSDIQERYHVGNAQKTAEKLLFLIQRDRETEALDENEDSAGTPPLQDDSEWTPEDSKRAYNIVKTEIFWLRKAVYGDSASSGENQALSLLLSRDLMLHVTARIQSLEADLANMRAAMFSEVRIYPSRQDMRELEKSIFRVSRLLPENLRPFPGTISRIPNIKEPYEQDVQAPQDEIEPESQFEPALTRSTVVASEKSRLEQQSLGYSEALKAGQFELAVAYLRQHKTPFDTCSLVLRNVFPDRAIYINTPVIAQLARDRFGTNPDTYINTFEQKGIVLPQYIREQINAQLTSITSARDTLPKIAEEFPPIKTQ
jgi:hypothetical protein